MCPCRTLRDLDLPHACREVVDKDADAVLDEVETAVLLVAASVLRGEGFTYTLPSRAKGNQLYVPGACLAAVGRSCWRAGRRRAGPRAAGAPRATGCAERWCRLRCASSSCQHRSAGTACRAGLHGMPELPALPDLPAVL